MRAALCKICTYSLCDLASIPALYVRYRWVRAEAVLQRMNAETADQKEEAKRNWQESRVPAYVWTTRALGLGCGLLLAAKSLDHTLDNPYRDAGYAGVNCADAVTGVEQIETNSLNHDRGSHLCRHRH